MKYNSSRYQLIYFITSALIFILVGCEIKGDKQPVRTITPQRSEDFIGVWHSKGDTIEIYKDAQGDWFYVKNPFGEKRYKFPVFISKKAYSYGSNADYDWFLKVFTIRGDQIKSMNGKLEISNDKSLMRLTKETGLYAQDFYRVVK